MTDCSWLQNDDRRTNTFVVKTCPANKVHLYHDEVNVYKAMSAENPVLDNMVRFYGSWRQGDTYNILLEYVDGGTLESFLERTHPPTALRDIVTLWEKFCALASLIALIHQHPHPNNDKIILRG
jgi:serine/threonine protein kinase